MSNEGPNARESINSDKSAEIAQIQQKMSTDAYSVAGATEGDVPLRASIPFAAWYALGLLTVINCFSYMDRIALGILMQSIKTELHLTDTQLGLLTGLAFALLYAALGLPIAWLADRTSRVRLISVCLSIWSIMTALSGFAKNFPHLFLARMGVGVGEAGCVPPAHSLIADTFPRDRRPLAIGIFQAGAAAGISGGLFLVGLLGEHLGWRASLQIIGIAGLPIALLTILTMREPPRPTGSDQSKESAVQALSALLRRPAFVHLTLAYAIGSICTYGTTQWLPTFLIRSFEMSMASVGLWMGLATGISAMLGLITGGLVATHLVQRDPRWELWIPTITYAIGVPLFILLVLSPNAFLVLALKTTINFVLGIGGGVALSSVQSFAESHRRATAVALTMFLAALLGMGMGPYLIGMVSDMLAPSLGVESLRYAFLVTIVMMTWSVVHFYIATKKSVKDRVD